MARIFLSYAHEDQSAARRIVDALAREGLDAWWDHDIPPGRTWAEYIGSRIKAAEIVIVIWSQRSIASNFVQEEAQMAFDAGKLLPVRIADLEPPMGFRRLHAANLAGWRGEADHRQWGVLLSEVRQRLGGAGQTPSAIRTKPTENRGSRGALYALLATGAVIFFGGGAVYLLNQPMTPDVAAEAPPETLDAAVETTTASSVPGTGADPEQPSSVDARAMELQFWRSCCTEANVDAGDYRSYLARYPNGEFASIAMQRSTQPAPSESMTPTATVVGTWVLEEYSNQTYVQRWRFNADGTAEWEGEGENAGWRGATSFRWTQEGNVITWIWSTSPAYSGPSRGTVNGNVMTGTEANLDGSTRATFRMRRL